MTVIEPDGTEVQHHLGYVKLVRPPVAEESRISARAVATYGLRVDRGVGIGFFEEKRLYVPLDCRVVLIVKDQGQLDTLAAEFRKNGGELCAAIDPGS